MAWIARLKKLQDMQRGSDECLDTHNEAVCDARNWATSPVGERREVLQGLGVQFNGRGWPLTAREVYDDPEVWNIASSIKMLGIKFRLHVRHREYADAIRTLNRINAINLLGLDSTLKKMGIRL